MHEQREKLLQNPVSLYEIGKVKKLYDGSIDTEDLHGEAFNFGKMPGSAHKRTDKSTKLNELYYNSQKKSKRLLGKKLSVDSAIKRTFQSPKRSIQNKIFIQDEKHLKLKPYESLPTLEPMVDSALAKDLKTYKAKQMREVFLYDMK